MKRIPSDAQILESIYRKYKTEFSTYNTQPESRVSKIFVPISCKEIAKKLKTDQDIVFGRLYYYLEQKYGYKREDDSNVHFFALRIQQESHCINFPLMVSVLAGLQEDAKKHRASIRISIFSLLVATSSATIAVYTSLSKIFAG